MTDDRRVEYRPLDALVANPQNPKAHDGETITDSIGRFGYIEPVVIDGRTGMIVSGHGRTEALRRARAAGKAAPEGVKVEPDGTWLAPVVVGWESGDDMEASAALIALNRTTEVGGWVDDSLLAMLETLQEIDGGLSGVGYTDEDIDALRESLEPGEGEGEGGPTYTRGTEIPHYNPAAEYPPEVWELADTTKRDELLESIAAATDLPDDVAEFLREAANRHVVVNYAKVAEFYAHATPEVQALMEESALVIIDSADALRHGYIRLSERMSEILTGDATDEYEGDDA